jgi:hypothetical protein
MASLWEIFDLSEVEYDSARGVASDDAGQGAPNRGGWIRTGNSASSLAGPNCLAWTSGSSPNQGTVAGPRDDWNDPQDFFGSKTNPWESNTLSCSNPLPVWCVQD